MANATSGNAYLPDVIGTRAAANDGIGERKAIVLYNVSKFDGRGNTFSGVKRIAGVTQRDGLPVARRVFLFVQPSMTLIRDAYTELP
ncbi:MAG: hypothetical protein ACRDAM_02655, partial [Casimicrobium sp.]